MSLKGKLALAAFILLIGISIPALQLYDELKKAQSDDPGVWEDAILAFEAEDQQNPPPADAVVFAGSSSIRMWDDLAGDMHPIPVIQRGFGGAKLADVTYYAERLISNYNPKAAVIFAGTNDIHPGAAKEPTQLLASYKELIERLHKQQPELPVYFIAITPSPMRWEVWAIATETNRLISEFSASSDLLHVIDTGPALLGADGQPERDNYIFDGLHLSKQGYAKWRDIIRQRLLDDFNEWAEQAK